MEFIGITKLIFLFLPLLCVAGVAQSEVRVRVKNESGRDFQNVKVNFKGQVENYGPLSSGKTSDYRQISLAYRYAYIEVLIAGKRYKFQPKDYVGEIPLEAGWFTYGLDCNSEYKTVQLHLIEDRAPEK